MLLEKWIKNKKIFPPDWLVCNSQYIALTGSRAYGTSTDESDYDYFGFCIPPKIYIFPHLYGFVNGFGPPPPSFNQFATEPPFFDETIKKEIDVKIFSIIKYFDLCAKNNPDCLDTLYVKRENVIHSTEIGNLVRDNRKKFLSQESYYRYSGYALSQLCKAEKDRKGNRKELTDKFGYDPKFLSHAVRLLGNAEMILSEETIELDKYKVLVSAIRNGQIGLDKVKRIVSDKENYLRKLLEQTKLPVKADYDELKKLLLQCLEIQYGNLEKALHIPTDDRKLLLEIKEKLKNIN